MEKGNKHKKQEQFFRCTFLNMPMIFNMVHSTFNIIFKRYGTAKHQLCPFSYLDKSRSYDVIIPNIYWNMLSKLPTAMINIHTKYQVDSCNGRVLFLHHKKKCSHRRQKKAVLSRCRVLHDYIHMTKLSKILIFIPL